LGLAAVGARRASKEAESTSDISGNRHLKHGDRGSDMSGRLDGDGDPGGKWTELEHELDEERRANKDELTGWGVTRCHLTRVCASVRCLLIQPHRHGYIAFQPALSNGKYGCRVC
jgi:hypothetical protein